MREGRAPGWIALALVLVLVVAATLDVRSDTATAPAFLQRIYVYLPSNVRPPMLQKVLATALPGSEVMVFRHLRDFETTVEETPPDFIIGARPFVDRYDRWKPVLQGFVSDRAEEPYVLVSVGKAVDVGNLPRLGIGVVDLLGKKGMPAFVARLLGTETSPKLIRVAQPEDLLPLLEFNLAGAVLMPARAVPTLREKSALDLRVTPLKTAFVGLPAVGVAASAPALAEMERKLMSLPPNVKSMLGVDEWRRQ
jgi:hypothetical protein